MEKRTSKKTKKVAIATTLALALALGGTLAYMSDVSSLIRNAFDTQPLMHVEIEETTQNAYEVKPGMTDPKDPTAIVTTTVDAFTYVIVTDGTQGNVDWMVENGWTELDASKLDALQSPKASGDSTYTASGEAAKYDHVQHHNGQIQASGDSIFTGASNQRVFYRTVSGDATGQAQRYPILKDNQVSYPADADIQKIADADPALYLDFQSYIIQLDPFKDAYEAWNTLEAEKRLAKEKIDAELAKYTPPNAGQKAAADAAKAAIDAATSTDAVTDEMDKGIEEIRKRDKSFTVTATSTNTSYGTVAPSTSTVPYGESCSITATEGTNCTFTGWRKKGTSTIVSTSKTLSVNNVSENLDYEAVFEGPLTVTAKSNNTSYGTVSPTSKSIKKGTTVTLTATDVGNGTFSYWHEVGSSTKLSTSRTYTTPALTSNKSYEAVFDGPVTITAATSSSEMGTASGTKTVKKGGTAVLTATPTAGHKFLGWKATGATSYASTSTSFTTPAAQANITYTATFDAYGMTELCTKHGFKWTTPDVMKVGTTLKCVTNTIGVNSNDDIIHCLKHGKFGLAAWMPKGGDGVGDTVTYQGPDPTDNTMAIFKYNGNGGLVSFTLTGGRSVIAVNNTTFKIPITECIIYLP